MVTLPVSVPEVPVIVTVDVPTVAVLLAVNVSTLVVVVGLVPNATVTPLGRPEAESVTLPANGLTSVIVMVTVQLPPWGSVHVVGEDAIVKLPVDGTTVSGMVVVAVVEPEVPVMVTVYVPAVAVALAVNVNPLVPVVGLVPYVTVTPLGNPIAARVTLPVNPPTSVTVTVSVAVLPCVTDRAVGEAASVKPDALTVRLMVMVAVSVPEVPVMVTVAVPAVAVALAVNVSTLLPVVGLVP
jgi:hypothetical protein